MVLSIGLIQGVAAVEALLLRLRLSHGGPLALAIASDPAVRGLLRACSARRHQPVVLMTGEGRHEGIAPPALALTIGLGQT